MAQVRWPYNYTQPSGKDVEHRVLLGAPDLQKLRVRVWRELNPQSSIQPVHWTVALSPEEPGEEGYRPLPFNASDDWKKEAWRVQRWHDEFRYLMENLIDAEIRIGVGWWDLARQVIGIKPAFEPEGGLAWAALWARVVLMRKPDKRDHGTVEESLENWNKRPKTAPTPFELGELLVPLFQALAAEGAILDETRCSGMLAQPPENIGVPALGISAAQVEELADEIVSMRHWDQAYQRGVCNYLLALDAATKKADEMIAWIDEWGDAEIREQPDWYKLGLIRMV